MIDLEELRSMAQRQAKTEQRAGEISSSVQWETIATAASALIRLEPRKRRNGDHQQ